MALGRLARAGTLHRTGARSLGGGSENGLSERADDSGGSA